MSSLRIAHIALLAPPPLSAPFSDARSTIHATSHAHGVAFRRDWRGKRLDAQAGFLRRLREQ